MKTRYNFLFKGNEAAAENEADEGTVKPRCIINPKNSKPVLAALMKKFIVPLVKTGVHTLAAKSPQNICRYL